MLKIGVGFMEKKVDLTKEQADKASAELQFWLGDNYTWLNDWLTNIVMINHIDAANFPSTFGVFTVPVKLAPPEGLVVAGNAMKAALINQAVFGHEKKQVIVQGAVPEITKFGGFIEAIGRKPVEADRVLFTAVEWFFAVQTTQLGLCLRTICTLDFMVEEK